jgi:hypothetical protein
VRYRLIHGTESMDQHPQGEWVKWQDVQRLSASPLPQEPREADARDAARYRWLRNRSAYFVYGEERQSPWTVIGTAYNDTRPCIGEELDVEVDAAMSTTESADSRGENRG